MKLQVQLRRSNVKINTINRDNSKPTKPFKPFNRILDISQAQQRRPVNYNDSVSLSPAARAVQRGGNSSRGVGETIVKPETRIELSHDFDGGRDRVSDRTDRGLNIFKEEGELRFRNARVGSPGSEGVTQTLMDLGDTEVSGTLALQGDTRTVIDGGQFQNFVMSGQVGGDHEVVLNLETGAALPRIQGSGQGNSVQPEDWQREHGFIRLPGVQRLLVIQDGERVASYGEPIEGFD